MIRLVLRLLFWPVVLALLLLAALPFTVTGTRWLLAQAEQLAPLTLEYAGGTLAGELALDRLAWSSESTRLELLGVTARLDRACLWRSVICLQDLLADELVIELLPGSSEEVRSPESAAPADPGELLVFPVSIEAPGLKLMKLRVGWDGGEWRQGALSGSVLISGSAIKVDRAVIREPFLQLAGTAASDERVVLPEIDLPLDLQVEGLALEQPGWDVYGSTGRLQSLRLGSGSWKNTELWLHALQVDAGDHGSAVASGTLEFSGQWPLAVTLDAFPSARPEWPDMLERHIRVDASGELADLVLELTIDGPASLAARGQLDSLDRLLPFSLTVDMDWPEQLVLAEQFAVPEQFSQVALRGPLVFAASGTLAEQVFQLEMRPEVPGYEQFNLHVAGRHQPELLTLEDLHIEDAPGANTLWGAGELRYGKQLQWSLALESSGLELSPLNENLRGRLQGQLQLDGRVAGSDWELALTDVSLEGEVNKLPARINGFAGLDSDLRLLPSQLAADLNGAILLLESASGETGGGRLELAVDELARWLPGGRGTLALQVLLSEGWQEFALDGSLQGLRWQGVEADSGTISGEYNDKAQRFGLDLKLADITFNGLDLENIHLGARGDSARQVFSLGSKGELDGELLITGSGDRVSGWSGQLAATSLQTPEGTWHLGEPVAVNFQPEPVGLMVAAHCWHYQQSRVCPGELVLAEQGSASVELAGGLAILSAFLPEYLAVTGELDVNLNADWAPGKAVALSGDVQGKDFVITRYFGSGESGSARWDSLEATLVNSEQGLELNSDLLALDGRHARLALQLPADRSRPLAGTLNMEGLQMGTLAPFFPNLATLEGELTGELQLAGTLAQPLATGSLQFSGGRIALLGNPTELQDLELLLRADGDRMTIGGRGLLGGGELNIKGVLLTRPEWRLELALAGGKHELFIPPYTRMLVSEQLQLAISGNQLDLDGDITVHEGTLEHERLPEGSVGLSGDVVEVDIHGNAISETGQFLTRMNVKLQLEDRFKITGDMVDATLGGNLQLLQKPGKPLQVFGNLNVIGGEVRAYQQYLRIQRGTISFTGIPTNPELDVRAQREISVEKVIVGLQVQGTLEQPRLDVYSDPVMSQANTMSYLIRGRALDTGAGSDGAVMALSLGTGLVNQSQLVAELNRIPGISNLAFGAEGNADDAAATLGGYVGERLYLSYGLGIYEPINVLTARLYLQTRLWLEVVSRLENSVDLYYSFDIN